MTQFKPLNIACTFVISTICFAALSTQAGGGMSGGGFGAPTLYNPSSLVLVDYLANSDITPKQELTGERAGYNTDIGLEGTKEIKTLSAQKLTHSRIEKWKGEYTVLAKILEHYASSMNWNFSTDKIKTPDELYVYSGVGQNASAIRPVLYFDYCSGVTANSNDYSIFTPASQSGSILHESFRQVQIRHRNLFPANFGTAQIQRMVTLMMFSEPQKLSVNDRELFAIFKTSNYSKIESQINAFKKQYCGNSLMQVGPQEICYISSGELLNQKKLGVILHDLSEFLSDSVIKADKLNVATKYRDSAEQIFEITQDLVEINVSATTVQYQDALINLGCKVTDALNE